MAFGSESLEDAKFHLLDNAIVRYWVIEAVKQHLHAKPLGASARQLVSWAVTGGAHMLGLSQGEAGQPRHDLVHPPPDKAASS